MALSTYSDLKASIASWLNRRDLTAQIPDFIRLAEDDINTKLRDRAMHTYVDAQVSAQPVALPADWQEAVRLTVAGSYRPLNLTTLDFIQELRGRRAPMSLQPLPVQTGVPRYFALAGKVIEFYPLPPAPVTVQMVYFAKVPHLTDAAPTNWLLEEDSGVLLFGALLAAEPFLKNDERIATWGGLYASKIAARNAQSDASLMSGGPIRRVRRGF